MMRILGILSLPNLIIPLTNLLSLFTLSLRADLPEGASVWDLGGTPRVLVAPAAKILTEDA